MENFNKEEFARLLELAKGSRSINQFAAESGVTAAHISRLLRCLRDTPPSPQVIRKLGDRAQNGVTYAQLMQAAGHLEPDGTSGRSQRVDVVGDYELRGFWEKLRHRSDLRALVKQVEDLPPDVVRLMTQMAERFNELRPNNI